MFALITLTLDFNLQLNDKSSVFFLTEGFHYGWMTQGFDTSLENETIIRTVLYLCKKPRKQNILFLNESVLISKVTILIN